jgi:hypothetical protein
MQHLLELGAEELGEVVPVAAVLIRFEGRQQRRSAAAKSSRLRLNLADILFRLTVGAELTLFHVIVVAGDDDAQLGVTLMVGLSHRTEIACEEGHSDGKACCLVKSGRSRIAFRNEESAAGRDLADQMVPANHAGATGDGFPPVGGNALRGKQQAINVADGHKNLAECAPNLRLLLAGIKRERPDRVYVDPVGTHALFLEIGVAS